jgi:hypothetical protein
LRRPHLVSLRTQHVKVNYMLRINIGTNRKVGEANYGSRGASVNLEIEVESGLAREPDKLQAKIDYLFDLAKTSVDAQLAAGNQDSTGDARDHDGNGSHANGNGHDRPQRNGRAATASQVRAINAIAGRQRTDLVGLVRDRFQAERVEDLSISEASGLIDELKASSNGAGGRR